MRRAVSVEKPFPMMNSTRSFPRLKTLSGRIIQKLRSVNPWRLIFFSVIVSEILTAGMNTVMGLLWYGDISYDLLMIGTVDAFIVSLIVSAILVFLLRHISGVATVNEQLEQEIGERKLLEEELKRANNNLELRVETRTFELKKINDRLQREIDAKSLAEEELSKSERFLATIFDSINDPFCIYNREYRIIKVNQAYADMKDKNPEDLTGSICHEALQNSKVVCDSCLVKKTFDSADPCAKEKNIVSPDGLESWVEIYTYPIFDGAENVSYVIQYARDITERKKTEDENKLLIQKLEYLSETDMLTNLLNRRALLSRLEKEVKRYKRYASELTIMICDVDNFKDINDTYGHHAGDRVLQEIAVILKKALRNTDIIGRYGGDEFMMISPETPITFAEGLAERLRSLVEETEFNIADDSRIKTSLSIGVAGFTRNMQDVYTLIKHADNALYVSKREGRNRVNSVKLMRLP